MRSLILVLLIGCETSSKTTLEMIDSGQIIQDLDQDGYISEEDCDDTSDLIHPGAVEICDGIDNNCDGQIEIMPTL